MPTCSATPATGGSRCAATQRYFLTAETLAGLEQAIMADYRDNPVSRDYDPLRAADGLDPDDEENDEDDEDFRPDTRTS